MRCLGVRLNGDAIHEVDERGQRIIGDTLLLMLNAADQPIAFTLPATALEERWETLLDTADPWSPPRRLRAERALRAAASIDGGVAANICRKEDLRRVQEPGTDGGRLKGKREKGKGKRDKTDRPYSCA